MNNALHFATYHGKIDVMRELLSSGVSPNERDACNNTPLHYAERARADVLFLLLRAGADVQAVNDAGRTPLDIQQEEQNGDLLSQVAAEVKAEKLAAVFKAIEMDCPTGIRRF